MCMTRLISYGKVGLYVSILEWTESYIWCNNDGKRDSSKCVQIRQNSITHTICLQYVSCLEQSQYIFEG
jgi:hypothetical protein